MLVQDRLQDRCSQVAFAGARHARKNQAQAALHLFIEGFSEFAGHCHRMFLAFGGGFEIGEGAADESRGHCGAADHLFDACALGFCLALRFRFAGCCLFFGCACWAACPDFARAQEAAASAFEFAVLFAHFSAHAQPLHHRAFAQDVAHLAGGAFMRMCHRH